VGGKSRDLVEYCSAFCLICHVANCHDLRGLLPALRAVKSLVVGVVCGNKLDLRGAPAQFRPQDFTD
jgi:hypothetical protein